MAVTARMHRIVRLLTHDRLTTYYTLGAKNQEQALQLYVRNLKLSSALFEVVGGFEVALRNSCHLTLSHGFQSDAWFDHVPFAWMHHEQDALKTAKNQVRARRKPLTPGRIVSNLTFGFWCGLTARPYASSLWVPHLHKAFPNKRLGRTDAFDRLSAIRSLRNRIAHHECILGLDLEQEYGSILETMGWICTETRDWIQGFSGFPELMASLSASGLLQKQP